jgi:ribosomal protein L11 methyltransferase
MLRAVGPSGRVISYELRAEFAEMAAENLRRNGVDKWSACLVRGSLAEPFKERFDVVAANILTHVIIELLGDVTRLLKPGGLFICSGIIDSNRDLVADKMRDMGLEVLDIRRKEGWVAMAGKCK